MFRFASAYVAAFCSGDDIFGGAALCGVWRLHDSGSMCLCEIVIHQRMGGPQLALVTRHCRASVRFHGSLGADGCE